VKSFGGPSNNGNKFGAGGGGMNNGGMGMGMGMGGMGGMGGGGGFDPNAMAMMYQNMLKGSGMGISKS
jgi:RNA-binding protein Musashi